MAVNARKKAIYEKRLTELNEELEAVYAQMGRDLNEAHKLRLKRQGQQIEQEIAGAENQLRQLEQSAHQLQAPDTKAAGSQGSSSKYNINIQNATGLVIGDDARVTQHFSGGRKSPGSAVPPVDTARLVTLTDLINRYFGLADVRDLCFRFGVDHEDLGGDGKREKARELVEQMERNGRLPDLIALLKQLRPHVDWE
jgi:hypothetical protein